MDGTTQEVVIKWRDALEVIHQHMLFAKYDPAVDLQLEPDITPELCHQNFDDCSNSMLYYLMDSYLSDGQCVLLYELSSDGSQCGDGRQDFWSVTTTPCIYRKHRRQMLDCKLLVGQLPRVVGADEKAHMYQHAIRRIFQSMNAAGRHGVRMYFRGARNHVCVWFRSAWAMALRAGQDGALDQLTMFPLLHSIPIDHPEHCIVAGILPGCAPNCQCSGCLTPKDSLGDLLASFPPRTEDTYRAFTAALEDASGEKALELYTARVGADPVDQHVGSSSSGRKRSRGEANARVPSIAAAKTWAKRVFHDMSFRTDLRPALLDFPAAGCGFAILGLSYDRLHMARTGAFKRLCLMVLAVYATLHGIAGAIAMLNARFASRGKHDGLDRYIRRNDRVLQHMCCSYVARRVPAP